MSVTDDSRFAEAEAEVSRGKPWPFRDTDAPNPLTILAAGWSSGHTKYGEADFLAGTDRNGTLWSVLVGSVVLRRRLIDGELSEWDDVRKAFVVTEVEGRVQPGEVVSIKYVGDKDAASGNSYPDFVVVRKPPSGDEASAGPPIPELPADEKGANDDIPF